jgi:hypothetical protein
MRFFNLIACCFLYKAKDLSASSYAYYLICMLFHTGKKLHNIYISESLQEQISVIQRTHYYHYNYVHHRLEDSNQNTGDWTMLMSAHLTRCAIGLARCQRISLHVCCVLCCNLSVHMAFPMLFPFHSSCFLG